MTNAVRYTEYFDLQSEFDELYEKSQKGNQFYNLMELITSRENIILAYRRIKSNTGSNTKGTDGLSIRDYKILDENEFLYRIRNRLANYKPDSIRRVYIDKQNGEKRPLGIPTMEDRLIQQAIKQVLEPICEAKFFKHSYGFRPNRSAHHAIARAVNLVNVGKNHFVVDVDIKGFFDNVNHNKLIRQIYTLGIRDKQLLAIIKKMLKAEISGKGIANKGVPQGGILSPLLSNIVLNELDQWIADQWETFDLNRFNSNDSNRWRALKTTNLKQGFLVRYADDFKIFTKDYDSAKRWFHAVKKFLNKRLGLEISDEKSKITNLRKRKTEFLGFTIKGVKKRKKWVANSYINAKKKEQIIANIRRLIMEIYRKRSALSMYDLNMYIRGIHNYFGIASHITTDTKEIAYRVYRMQWNHLKRVAKYGQFKVKGYERYNYHTFKIREVALIPIGAIKCRIPKQFNQELTDYTNEGRNLAEKHNLPINMLQAVRYLGKSFIQDRSIQYNDNRISKFSAARGKCHITGIDLTLEIWNYHCHHKIPQHLGGTDEYDNLIVLHKYAHTLVHATKKETINKYLKLLNLEVHQIKKLNKLRELCKLEPINW